MTLKTALFVTCLVDGLFPDVGRATITLLERLGQPIDFPMDQTCCGQMHINTGYQTDAVPLICRFLETFEPYDAILVPSASCAGCVRHQYPMLARRHGDSNLIERCTEIAAKTYELSEFLVDVLGVSDVGAYFPHRVTYHPTCHSLRLLALGERPLHLLHQVRGLDLVPLPDAESCCGFGGTFALKNPDVSVAMLADKMRHIRATGAEMCSATDSSCLMHIGGGLSRLRAGLRTIHFAEILASTEGMPWRG